MGQAAYQGAIGEVREHQESKWLHEGQLLGFGANQRVAIHYSVNTLIEKGVPLGTPFLFRCKPAMPN